MNIEQHHQEEQYQQKMNNTRRMSSTKKKEEGKKEPALHLGWSQFRHTANIKLGQIQTRSLFGKTKKGQVILSAQCTLLTQKLYC